MNRRSITRLVTLGAVAALAVGTLAGCAAGGGDDGRRSTLTFWHNSTTGPGKAYWEQTRQGLRGRAPRRHDQDPGHPERGHGRQAPDRPELRRRARHLHGARRRQAGRDRRGRPGAGPHRCDLGRHQGRASARHRSPPCSVDGKVYGMPFSILPGGIYYSKDLFAQAGITDDRRRRSTSSSDAVDKLKAAGIAPIALGAKDAWPAAHWYYFFALRACSQDVWTRPPTTRASTTRAGCRPARTSRTFAATEPFNEGFLDHLRPAGRRLARRASSPTTRRRMELMGALGPGRDRLADARREAARRPGLVPLPRRRRRRRRPGAMMGGVDGYSLLGRRAEGVRRVPRTSPRRRT